MNLRWTFGQKIAAGFAAVLALTVIGSLLNVRALRSVVTDKDRVLTENSASLIDAAKFQGAVEYKVAAVRGFLLTDNEKQAVRMTEANNEADRLLHQLMGRERGGERESRLNGIATALAEYSATAENVVALRRGGTSIEEVAKIFEETVIPKRLALDRLVDDFVAYEETLLAAANAEASAKAANAQQFAIAIVVATTLLAIMVAAYLSRRLSRDIGAAIEHIRSSATELQSASNQQTTSAREQATSMSEISTTVSELLATSRQIAESSQRVAHIADETASAAKSGDQTVRAAHESITGIKHHVDHVVTYMLDLGKKSQQIGSVVDIINELAEQTNILSINASIEAAGAGEGGRRFAVVAEEIRKLAERVGGSTREIGTLIEDIRAAVNTTVMATEGGAKAVDAGTRQFGEVTAALDHIVKLVATSTDAAREIELSTKQQTTAVEQVNIAIVSAAQATKESEASSGQTLQTASQLAKLSGELAQLV